MDIIDKIRSEYTNLSKTQRKIADYLLEHSNRVAFMTLRKMSEEVNTAEVTILNFSKKIGCSSFIDLKSEFQAYIKSRSVHPEKLSTALSKIESIDSNLAEIINSEMNCVEDAINKIDVNDIKNATKLIKEASKVYLIGAGISEAVANFLLLRLKHLGISAEIFNITSYNLVSLQMCKRLENSVFIVVSLPTYTKLVTRFVEYLRENNNSVIALTDSLKSPVAKYANVVFTCSTNSVLFFNTITGLISISNILLTSLAIESKEGILNSIEQLKEFEERFLD
ncbi:MurR/RpiR family transcriptional regulator [Wukongibacter baidiensis]|uniref:MurR/RpiR family transcriptional regulator n=1 Tax=Wukongibacter baidiensis TaxID=1723361 RepID=UPI003D800012